MEADRNNLTLKPSEIPYSWCSNIRPATEEEKQLLINALHEKGKDWDFEKLEIVDYRWRAKIDNKYWYVDSFGRVQWSIEENHEGDTLRFNSGNYFKDIEEAESYRKYCLSYKK